MEIEDILNYCNLPKEIAKSAIALFKRVYDGENLDDYEDDTIACVCIHIASGLGYPQSLEQDLYKKAGIKKREKDECLKLILRDLDTSVDRITSGRLITKFCSDLDLSKVVESAIIYIARKAVEIIEIIRQNLPISVVAAAIYMTSQV